MSRGSPILPAGGLAAAFVALLLWVSSVAWRRLDAVVLTLFVVGCGLSLAGYLIGEEPSTRRLAVVGLGVNAFGAVLLALVYAAG